MKVFVTGNLGYIGAHLVSLLKLRGVVVLGCDLNLYPESLQESITLPDQQFSMNIRNLSAEDLQGCDCVIHLAAISNDPMGKLNPELTEQVNRDDSFYLAQIAKEAGVPRFIFSSSCSIYGQSNKEWLDESSMLAPQSVYAYSKIEAEKEISTLANPCFSPLFLRNATAYGYSSSLRLDLVANDFLSSAFTRKEIRIHSDGTSWRPMIHVKDIARVIVAFLELPRTVTHNLAVNVGEDQQNMQVKDIANRVLECEPSATLRFTGEIGKDSRNYRVSFALLRSLLPSFTFQYTINSGMEELREHFIQCRLSEQELKYNPFNRLYLLKKRLLENPKMFDLSQK